MKIKNKIINNIYFSLSTIICVLLIMCIFLSNFFNTDYISLMLFIVFLFVCIKNNFHTIPKYIAIYFYTSIFLIGNFICENSHLYLRELAVFSEHHGSFPVAIFYSFLLINFLILFDKLYSRKMHYKPSQLKTKFPEFISKFIYAFVFFVGFILFLSVITKPSFKFGIDRFQYEQLYLNKYVKLFASYYKYCLPLVFLPEILKNKKFGYNILKIIISLTPYVLYKVWIGNKFGALFDIVILFLPIIIFYIGNFQKNKDQSNEKNLIIETNKKENKKFVLSIAIIFAFLAFVLGIFYVSRGKDAFSSILDRVSQQGQLWWKTYDEYELWTFHLDEIGDEIEPLFNYKNMSKFDYNYGVYKIMQLTTPANIYKAKITTGARYSAQGIEIAYYYLSFVGIVIHALLRAFCTVLITNLFIKYFFSGRLIESVIMTRILIISNSVFTQGDLYNLTKIDFIIMIIIVIGMEIFFKKFNNKDLIIFKKKISF